MDSRYLAIVRRATFIPLSWSLLDIFWSLRGFAGGSLFTSSWMNARIAVEEHSPPVSVDTWLEKKYLNS